MKDVPFGFPMATSSGGSGGVATTSEERQRLIETGQLTPFGTTVEPCGVQPALSSPAAESSTSSSSGGGGSSSTKVLVGFESAEVNFDAHGSNDKGLFPDVITKRVRKARIPKKNTSAPADDEPRIAAATSAAIPHSSPLEPEMEIEENTWVPSLEDLLDDDSGSPSSGKSDYFTDEELGGKKRKKKKKLRELSSDGLSDEEDVQPSKRKGKRSRRRRKKAGHLTYNDDGDEDLYRQRIR